MQLSSKHLGVSVVAILVSLASCAGGASSAAVSAPTEQSAEDVGSSAAPTPAPTETELALDQDEVTRSFQRRKSGNTLFPQNRASQSFYMALRARSLAPDLQEEDCVKQNGWAWLRRLVKKDAKSVAISIGITGPTSAGLPKITVPIFEHSRNEQANPAACRTVITDRVITPFFVADQNTAFGLDAELRTNDLADFAGAQTLLSVAGSVLTFAGGNADLIQQLSGAEMAGAAKQFDDTWSQNWSTTNQRNYDFEIRPWPLDGDPWLAHVNSAQFSLRTLEGKSKGIRLSDEIVPIVVIEPAYKVSVFGNGPGNYIGAGRILAHKTLAVTGDTRTLSDIFNVGLGGTSTANALTITDRRGMRSFCINLSQSLNGFLTEDDALAARYAVLSGLTSYYELEALQGIRQCMTEAEEQRLLELNSNFTTDFGRELQADRTRYVNARIGKLAIALRTLERDDVIERLIEGGDFRLDVSSAASVALPAREGIEVWGNVAGEEAVTQLLASGGFRVGCARALPGRDLSTILAVGLNRETNKPLAMVLSYSIGDPSLGGSVEADADMAKLQSMKIMPIDDASLFFGSGTWPRRSCSLL